MAQAKIKRLAYCEYVLPDAEGSIAVWAARLDLMRAVNRLFPEMLQRLSSDVLPAYAELAKSGFSFDSFLWHPRLSPRLKIPEDSLLKTALSQWAIKYHAETDWFLDETLKTLRGWHVAPDWRESLRWNPHSGVTSTLTMGREFEFACEGWEMQLLTWDKYVKSVRK